MNTCHRIKLSLPLYKISLLNSLGWSRRVKKKSCIPSSYCLCHWDPRTQRTPGSPFRPLSPGGGLHSLLWQASCEGRFRNGRLNKDEEGRKEAAQCFRAEEMKP